MIPGAASKESPSAPASLGASLLFNRLQSFSDDLVLVDVRPAAAYDAGHIMQAINAPPPGTSVASVRALVPEGVLPAVLAQRQRGAKDGTVVLYDSGSGAESPWLTSLSHSLAARGDVLVLEGGYAAFAASHPFACTTESPATSDTYFSHGHEFPTEVIEGLLYLGDRRQAADGSVLERLGITHVINVTRELENFFPESVAYDRIPVDDEASTDLLQHLDVAVVRLASLASKPENKILVHCRLGLSRSASVVLAYLMYSRGLNVDDALEYLRARRHRASPNRGFLRQLETFQRRHGIAPRASALSDRWREVDDIPDLPKDLDVGELPRHLGLIMDGNRRWARVRGQVASEGHLVGQDVAERVIRCAARWGLKAVSLFAFSTENWARPQAEVLTVFDAIEIGLVKMRPAFEQEQIRLCIVGDLDDPRVPATLREVCRTIAHETRDLTRCLLTLAINHGGRQELAQLLRRAYSDGAAGRQSLEHLDEAMISSWMAERAPGGDIDLLIRTSGEQRISNFMLWQVSYAELYFTEKMFPQFDVEDLAEALREYQRRQRRFGN
jgi:undecaprenyl diphosphate synthase